MKARHIVVLVLTVSIVLLVFGLAKYLQDQTPHLQTKDLGSGISAVIHCSQKGKFPVTIPSDWRRYNSDTISISYPPTWHLNTTNLGSLNTIVSIDPALTGKDSTSRQERSAFWMGYYKGSYRMNDELKEAATSTGVLQDKSDVCMLVVDGNLASRTDLIIPNVLQTKTLDKKHEGIIYKMYPDPSGKKIQVGIIKFILPNEQSDVTIDLNNVEKYDKIFNQILSSIKIKS